MVSLVSKAPHARQECAMGKGAKRIAARSEGLNACKANDPGGRKEADRRCRTSRLVSLVTRVGMLKGGCTVQTPHHVSVDSFVANKALFLMTAVR